MNAERLDRLPRWHALVCCFGAIAILLAYEHWLVRPDDLTRVKRVFFQVNGIISVGLFLLVVVQLAVTG